MQQHKQAGKMPNSSSCLWLSQPKENSFFHLSRFTRPDVVQYSVVPP